MRRPANLIGHGVVDVAELGGLLAARRAYNSPIASNRRAHAAFSSRDATPIDATTPASSTDSNIRSMIAGATDKFVTAVPTLVARR
jgi:hypothetical protein